MDVASKIGMEILNIIDGEEVADVGIGLTEALSVFLAMCELHHEGGTEQAKRLLVTGIEKLQSEAALDVIRMRDEGLSDDQIRERLRQYIPENATEH